MVLFKTKLENMGLGLGAGRNAGEVVFFKIALPRKFFLFGKVIAISRPSRRCQLTHSLFILAFEFNFLHFNDFPIIFVLAGWLCAVREILAAHHLKF